ncbi:MAG: hydrogen gas-evolving membrane-bound hydrogenase subunit E [Ilumatobacteraceae bacterium]
MIACLIAFAVVGSALMAAGARLGRRAFLVAAIAPAVSAIWVATQLRGVTRDSPVTEQVRWIGGLDLTIALRLDGTAGIMSLVISVVGVAVLCYAFRYFAPDAPDLGRLAGLLVLFGGSMLGLVQADHLLVLYACWELTSITSFLLIGNRHTESRARAAALHALLVTGAGGLALLGGLVLLAREAGSYRISEILADPPASSSALTVAMCLLAVGALTKSAQYPFHAWLPGAMAAPTPVSAYLHSATMVKAGIVLVARFAPMFAEADLWRPILVTAGCCTFLVGGLRALRQHDLKLLLAFGTVSQLGLLMVLFAAGTAETATAGWVLLLAHAAFKAALFMVVGAIDHQTGTRDIRSLPPLGPGWRVTEVVTLLALVSMAGVPFGAGFIAKELAYDSLGDAFRGGGVVLAVAVAGSMLTVAYGVRFYWGAFVAPRRRRTERADPSAPSRALLAPAAVLAVVGIIVGLAPGLLDEVVQTPIEDGYAVAPGTVHLALWHGLGLPLALSGLTLAGGTVLALADRRLQPVLARGGAVPSGAEIYRSVLHGLGVVSTRVTAVIQNGSLPVYAGVILATAAAVPTTALLVARDWPDLPAFGSATEAPIVVALMVGALGAAIIRRRFAAAVFLGATGYAMAGLFVLAGAPDLALTQAAVETLSTVVFVLVLRRLPERFERQSSHRRRIVRIAVAGAVSAMVFVFALVAAGHRLSPPVSDEMVARSVPDGHGRNVVNVILVDFRGFDTLGEITVLAVASIGAVALARVGRRAADAADEVLPTPTSSVRRLAFVDVSVRVVFHAVLVMSLWLLFAGHNQPGGGFVGGLLAGSAITLRYIAGGSEEVRATSRFRPWTVLGVGILLAAATATIPLLAGGSVLEVGVASLDLPGLAATKVSSALAFDTGVYLAVVGMVLMAFEAFGDEPAEVTS